MRRVLLDTNVLLWWLGGNPALGRGTRKTVADAETEVFVSAASLWEISIKLELGKLKAARNMEREVACAINIRSKGSRWIVGREPACWP
jgi:PIN domain nuclease of toxin-antitoxin system